MPRIRMGTVVVLVVMTVGLVATAIVGLFQYMGATATPLHPAGGEIPSVFHVDPTPAWTAAVEQGRQVVRTALREQNLPGVSVAVGVGGDLVWAEGFGWADLERRVPVAPDTRFRIGTASVALTSAAVGLLLERGRLSLDDEIQQHVPAFSQKPWPVTLRQVMGHVAGVRNDGGDEGPLFGVRCERPVDALAHFADRPLLFEPGTRYHYSSYGWILVSAAIEEAAGEPFLRFMRKQVFEPLGMDDTAEDVPTDSVADRATSYFPRFAADPGYGPDPMREIDLSCYAGASAFVSTPSDLVRFGLAIAGHRLLQPATTALLHAPLRLPSGEDTGYGLGWDIETVTLAGTSAPAIGHDGGLLGGTTASFLMVPERGLVVAVTANISYADTFTIASRIAEGFAR